MSISISTTLKLIANEIANDAALEAWCQAAYTKSPSIYVYIDPKNPPKINKAPWVGLSITNIVQPTAQNGHVLTFTLETACFISSSGETTVGKVTTLDGFAALENFSDLVYTAIEAATQTTATQSDLTIMEVDATEYGIADFPGFIATRSYILGKKL